MCVAPVDTVIQALLNISSAGGLRKKLKEVNVQTLVHPYILFFTDRVYRFERKSRIEFFPYERKTGEKCFRPIRVGKTVGELITNFLNSLNGTFDSIIRYDPRYENSQVFVNRFLRANNLDTDDLTNFYKQDTSDIMGNFEATNKLVSHVTLLGLALNRIFVGEGQ